ncbi:STAS domain-containing protein [Streptomyces chrestomyceticus]|uniref:STAS domain-containing protein n=1 Tax=Streptomyces chrestomyceticus TaxID=68185 RepID=UPI0036BC0041
MFHPTGTPRLPGPVHTYRLDEATVAELRGEIDLWTAPAIRTRLQHLAAEFKTTLLIDLRPVTFFGCQGLEVLLDVHQRIMLSRGRLAVVCGDARILDLMSATGTHSLFQPAATLDEALAW